MKGILANVFLRKNLDLSPQSIAFGFEENIWSLNFTFRFWVSKCFFLAFYITADKRTLLVAKFVWLLSDPLCFLPLHQLLELKPCPWSCTSVQLILCHLSSSLFSAIGLFWAVSGSQVASIGVQLASVHLSTDPSDRLIFLAVRGTSLSPLTKASIFFSAASLYSPTFIHRLLKLILW